MSTTSYYFYFIFNDKGLIAWNLSFLIKLAWQAVYGQRVRRKYENYIGK